MKINYLILAITLVFTSNAFAQNYDMSRIPYRIGNKWGFATPQKQILLTPKYEEVRWFSEGYAAVRIGKKWGYINTAGKLVIPAKFTVAKDFTKGYMPGPKNTNGDTILYAGASVRPDKYEICINTKGTMLKGCPAKEAEAPVVASIEQKKKYTVANDGYYDLIEDDYKVEGETYYIAKKNGNYGVFNTKFEMILPFEYASIKKSKVGEDVYLMVSKNGRYGLNTYMGKEVMEPSNTKMTIINGLNSHGYVIMQNNGLTYVKNMDGTPVIDRGYNEIMYDNNGGFVVTGDGNLKGFYFNDNTYIAPKYTAVRLLPGGKYIWVKTYSGQEGIVGPDGTEYFK